MKKKFDVRFTSIYLGARATFKINYNGKLYSGCVMRNWICECAENEKIKDISDTQLGCEMLLATHHALHDTPEYKAWIKKIEEMD